MASLTDPAQDRARAWEFWEVANAAAEDAWEAYDQAFQTARAAEDLALTALAEARALDHQATEVPA